MTRHAVMFGIFAAILIVTGGASPAPDPQTKSATAPTEGIEQIREQMLAAVNKFRVDNGLTALVPSTELDAAAQGHAADVARRGSLSHYGSDGSNPGERARRAGYPWHKIAENIAQGQASVAETVTVWEHSPPHRTNLLTPDLHDIGSGYAKGVADGYLPGDYWVIELGRR